MTLSPEERAKAVEAELDGLVIASKHNREVIATAIREVEDAALERAAVMVESGHIDADDQPGYGQWEWGSNEAGRSIRDAIRNLKHPKD